MKITTQNKLTYLNDTKTAIKNALIDKGQTVADADTFRSYAEKVLAIPTQAAPVLESLEVTENGTYTPPEGVDGYNPVTVNVEGSGSALKFFKKNVAISASLNQRIDVDFGFTPDFILLYPATTLSTKSNEVFATAISEKWASTFGVSQYYEGLYYGSSSLARRNSGSNMQSTTSNAYLYAVDSTGFKLGDNYSFASTTYTIVAMGL